MTKDIVETSIKVKVPSGGHVCGIMTSSSKASTVIPGSRVVLIAHGFAGHKDYCYQKNLAQELTRELELFTFRFDFRGCGESSPVSNPKAGRTIRQSDFEDFEAVVQYFNDKGFIVNGIVSHSRGSVAMFHWALETMHRREIPTLVNVSGRYHSPEFLGRIRQAASTDNIERDGYTTTINFEGKYRETVIPWEELLDVGSIDLSAVNTLPKSVHVLSVYGAKDHIVPLADADSFAHKLKPRHTLRLIGDADHNFYQTAEDGSRINHNGRVVDIITDWFSPDSERDRFLSQHLHAGIVPRWKDVDGINNFRDFGGYKSKDNKLSVRPGYLFRCANPAYVTEKGAQTMRDLGIKKIFDLRSEQELQRAGIAEVDGIENCWIPIFRHQDLSPEALAKRAQMFTDPMEGYQRAYRELLEKAPHSYVKIMEHIRDSPEHGFVVHCTAGKDRTGVICALILLLMGVDADTVAREYELTTLGLASEMDRILHAVEKDNKDLDEKGRISLLGSRYESMRGTIEVIEQEYGGAYNYFKSYCKLSDDDLATIKKNLTADGAIGWRWVL